jgi:hypothetical protein
MADLQMFVKELDVVNNEILEYQKKMKESAKLLKTAMLKRGELLDTLVANVNGGQPVAPINEPIKVKAKGKRPQPKKENSQ